MTIREQIEQNELKILSPNGTLSKNSKGRVSPEEQCNIRTVFMRDRDRILHSEAFRRLKHKTQVFFIATNDHYRTRLTHTLEVAGIARTISKALQLNEELTEAIALGHDLGHPPFGHIGEEMLNQLYCHGFRHNVQSLRMVDRLESGKGLNLTFEVRDGILKHSKGIKKDVFPIHKKDRPRTLEGQVVRIADRLSYLNHDVDDAIRSGILKPSDIPASILSCLGERYSIRINTMVQDVVSTSRDKDMILMTPQVRAETEKLKNFLYKHVYTHQKIVSEAIQFKKIIADLYHFFGNYPEIILKKMVYTHYKQPVVIDDNCSDKTSNLPLERRIVDYIAMMTDQFALQCHKKYIQGLE